MRRQLTILGATGSIGVNTLAVLEQHPQHCDIFALTAHQNLERLLLQCQQHRPRYAVVATAAAAQELEQKLRASDVATQVLSGPQALIDVASDAEVTEVMAAIVGAAGLPPTIAAARAGKRIYLANKEALVMSGAVFMQSIAQQQAELLPIDSEHNALFQCLPPGYVTGTRPEGVSRLILTASGGPFRQTPLTELARVTPAEACAHPNWVMGRKISVDSATMMNKALEVIEAHYLFALPAKAIEVLLHPQSVVHSLVEYLDGSQLAQLGSPDMRVPIAHALAWPQRFTSGAARLNLQTVGRLDFSEVDPARFPCLGLAYQVLESESSASCVLNAANEVAVDAFLQGQLAFNQIYSVIAACLDDFNFSAVTDLSQILAIDAEARRLAQTCVQQQRERQAC